MRFTYYGSLKSEVSRNFTKTPHKNDKRIFSPKRIKQMGWTVNFANPISIFAIITLVAIIYFIANYLKSL